MTLNLRAKSFSTLGRYPGNIVVKDDVFLSIDLYNENSWTLDDTSRLDSGSELRGENLVIAEAGLLSGESVVRSVDVLNHGNLALGDGLGLAQAKIHNHFFMGNNRQTWLARVADDCRSAKLVWHGSFRQRIGGVMNTAHLDGEYVYGCGTKGRCLYVRRADGQRRWSSF